jgi:hypothetical protein
MLAACVDAGHVRPDRGHALLVYDERNPAFQPRSGGAVEALRAQMHDSSTLRRCSWQAILKAMHDVHDLRWLVTELGRKYGLRPRGHESPDREATNA